MLPLRRPRTGGLRWGRLEPRRDRLIDKATREAGAVRRQLEYALRGVIKSLTGKGLLVSLDSTFTQRAWSLRKDILDIAEAKLGAGAHLISLGDLIDQAEAVSLRRNKYLHSLYAQELDGDPMLLTEERKGGKGSKIERKREPIPTPDQLNALAREIETLADKLH